MSTESYHNDIHHQHIRAERHACPLNVTYACCRCLSDLDSGGGCCPGGLLRNCFFRFLLFFGPPGSTREAEISARLRTFVPHSLDSLGCDCGSQAGVGGSTLSSAITFRALFFLGLTFHCLCCYLAFPVTERQLIDQKSRPKKMPQKPKRSKAPLKRKGKSKRPKSGSTAVRRAPEAVAKHGELFIHGPAEVETFRPYVEAVRGMYPPHCRARCS